MKKNRPSFLYFVRAANADGLIKIGISQSPLARMSGLVGWSPVPLELVVQIEAPREAEGRVHGLLGEHHSHGEWFRPAPAVIALMQSVIDGTFDPDALPIGAGRAKCLSTRRKPFTDQEREYAGLYDICFHRIDRLPWPHGFRRPTAPSIFQLRSAATKAKELAEVKELIAAIDVRLNELAKAA